MIVSHEVLAVLDAAEISGVELRLVGQLDRKLYLETNKVLEAAGGKWNRSAKAHLFPEDPTDVIDRIALTGEITRPQDFGYFPTPPAVVDVLLARAELEPGMAVLEPSAGRGAIAEKVALTCDVDCVELLPGHVDELKDGGYARTVRAGDFLDLAPEPIYDRVVMNPPFGRQADITHVLAAFAWLRPGGRLVAVMSNAVAFRTNRLAEDFRALVEECDGSIEPLPPASFRVSGTDVNTVVVVLPKPEHDAEAAA